MGDGGDGPDILLTDWITVFDCSRQKQERFLNVGARLSRFMICRSFFSSASRFPLSYLTFAAVAAMIVSLLPVPLGSQ